jgi:hypothetical protein
MDTQHANHPGHELTLQQLLRALNEELLAQTASGQLASDLGVVRIGFIRSVLTRLSCPVFSSKTCC